jgi:hypothetical protein
MLSTNPVASYAELSSRFPGIEQLDPSALGRFAFHAAVHTPGEIVRHFTSDERSEDWHDEIREVWRDVSEWQQHTDQPSLNRYEMAMRVADDRRRIYQVHNLIGRLAESTSDEGYTLVQTFLEEGSYQLRTELGPSPLFPKGRTVRTPLSELRNPETGSLDIPYGSDIIDGNERVLDDGILTYVTDTYPRQKASEQITAAFEMLEEVEKGTYESLRAKYGAKAAGLICFTEKLDQLKSALHDNSYSVDIDVPSFIPVSTDMYEAWLEDPSTLSGMSEAVRSNVLQLPKDEYAKPAGLVVVRSSAVKSEDGEEFSGAGVYKSIAVDPRDAKAFQEAIEEVYRSARSHAALTYQNRIGVTDEFMGLVIQEYREQQLTGSRPKMYYGHVDSVGVNRNLIEVHTTQGTLLYDKPAVMRNPLLQDSDRHNGSLLHTSPDHSTELRSAIIKTGSVPHAAVVAERVFGKPMQLEFVNNSIVQVRPLRAPSAEVNVSFPLDVEVVAESAASGIGDMQLQRLDETEVNSGKRGFVIFHGEYGFTMSNFHAGYDALPDEGAVIIMEPSDSGHIQAICRERGLLCFYPKKGSSLEELEEVVYEQNGRFRGEPRDIKLHFVADGYVGRIYGVTSQDE